ncbi:MAG: SURF1 family protein [Cycloclasticus sp.]|nr:SURF1 family protein [Cycloclasticus sp.]MBQ0790702.1 SURF1 family protein [Cycloclasticus sp.]
MQFKFNFILTLLAVLVLGLLLGLGYWQLDRAEQKQALLDLQAARVQLAPVAIESVRINKQQLRYLPVTVSGTIDADQQILIDNQIKQGRAGYFVLTPIKLSNNSAILLNRGWLPLGDDRNTLPDVKVNTVELSVNGRLDHFPSVGIALEGADVLSKGWPAVVQTINLAKVSERLGYAVMPYQVLLNNDELYGYEREWTLFEMGPEKHHGYAFQWFALALTWLIIYFVVTIKTKTKKT